MDKLLSRGITQANYMIYQQMRHVGDWLDGGSVVDIRQTFQCLAMLQLFLAPTYEALSLMLRDAIEDGLGNLKSFLIIFFVCYMAVTIIAHFIFWTCYLRETEEELVKSRDMPKIMPLKLIDKL
jgi:hypothetical protein